jgi:hypothetical protein
MQRPGDGGSARGGAVGEDEEGLRDASMARGSLGDCSAHGDEPPAHAVTAALLQEAPADAAAGAAHHAAPEATAAVLFALYGAPPAALDDAQLLAAPPLDTDGGARGNRRCKARLGRIVSAAALAMQLQLDAVYSEVPDQNASCARFIAAHHLADGEPALPPPEMQHPPAASAEEEEDDDGMPAAQAAHAPPHAAGWHSAGSCDGVSEPDDMRDDSVDDGIAAARSGTRRPRAR